MQCCKCTIAEYRDNSLLSVPLMDGHSIRSIRVLFRSDFRVWVQSWPVMIAKVHEVTWVDE